MIPGSAHVGAGDVKAHTLEEVGFEIHIEDVTTQTLDGIIEGQNVDTLAVLDVEARVYIDHVTELDTEVVTRDFVQLDLALLDIVGAQADENGVVPLLPPVYNLVDQNSQMDIRGALTER